MTRRYYVPELMTSGLVISLPDEEALHAVRVMRVNIGDAVELFDGVGNQASGQVVQADKRSCVCRIESPVVVDREPSRKLTLVTAIPKPDRAKEMIERLTEMGVDQIQPIVFERTQRGPTDSLIGKLDRIVIEACKQSGRNHLMRIFPMMTFGKWITTCHEPLAPDKAMTRLVAMPGGKPLADVVGESNVSDCVAVIGPEGGLTESELQDCLDASIEAVDLGKRILRIETAACVVAARILGD